MGEPEGGQVITSWAIDLDGRSFMYWDWIAEDKILGGTVLRIPTLSARTEFVIASHKLTW